MTLAEMKKFCAAKGQYAGGRMEWAEEPFRLGDYIGATNGHVFVAEKRPIAEGANVPEIPKDKQKGPTRWLKVETPKVEYSTEHCLGFCGPKENGPKDSYGFGKEFLCSDPMRFNGHCVDRRYIRQIMESCGETYRYTYDAKEKMFTFKSKGMTFVLMGMRETQESDPRYTPKAVASVATAK